MKVLTYRFGELRLSNQVLTKDAILTDKTLHYPWWRKEGHRLSWEDLAQINLEGCSTLIVGTGWSGCMKVDPEVIQKLKEKGIEVEIYPSQEAVKRFNTLEGAALAIHLTC